MMITEQENIIFEKWSKIRPGFIPDGVVDEESYLLSNPKLLFVLKEANDPEGGNWDLRGFLRKGARKPSWNNIALWIKGIRNLPQDIEWKLIEGVSEQDRSEMLKSICAINLKKSPGGYMTDNDLLNKVATEDQEYINQQFSLYNPDFIICCGSSVSHLFNSLILFKYKPEWKTTRRGIWYCEYEEKKYVIAYSHPEARVADCLLFYGILDAVREINYPELMRNFVAHLRINPSGQEMKAS